MDYFSTIFVLLVMTLCYSNEIAAQRKHAFVSRNSQRHQNNGFDRNSRTSTSKGFASNRKSIMISDPANAFNYRHNARRVSGLNIRNNFRGRQTGGTFRNRPVNPKPPSNKRKSPSFSMPVLPNRKVQQPPITTTPGYMPPTTTVEQYIVGAAVVSKPAELSSWGHQSNGRSTPRQWRGNNNVKNGPNRRTDEYIYMVNGHPARPHVNNWGNDGGQKQDENGNTNNNAGRETFQSNSNSVNKRQSLTNNFHQNSNYLNKNRGQLQGTRNKNTVQPAFKGYSNDPVNYQTMGRFQQTVNNRKSGGIANNNNIHNSNRHASAGQGRLGAGGLSNTNDRWRKGSMSSPENMMTLTPNENNIGMNRLLTTTSGVDTNSVPSTMPIRITHNGRVLPSVMPQLSPTLPSAVPQLSPTRSITHLRLSGHYTPDTDNMKLASIPQSRQYISSPVSVNKLPLPSPGPVGTSAIPADSLHINTRIVHQSYPSPTSMTMKQPTPGFNRSPVPPYFTNNQGYDSSPVTGSARSGNRPNSGISASLYHEPIAPPRHRMGLQVPPVIGMEPMTTQGQNRVSRPEIHMRPRTTPGHHKGARPTPETHMRPRTTPGHHKGARPTPSQHFRRPASGQHNRQRPTPSLRATARPTVSRHMRQRPTPGQHIKPNTHQQIKPRPTPSQHLRIRPASNQHKRQRPTPSQHTSARPTTSQYKRQWQTPSQHPKPTMGHQIKPKPTPIQQKRSRPTSSRYTRPTPTMGQRMRPTPTQGQYTRHTSSRFLKPKPTQGLRTPQGPIHDQKILPIIPPKHALGGMSQFVQRGKSHLGPIRSTLSPRGLLAPVPPSVPLKHSIDIPTLPEKQQYHRNARPPTGPTGPLVETKPSPMSIRGKMNWQRRQSLSPILHQLKPIRPSLSPRRQSLGPLQLSSPPKAQNNLIKIRPTARAVGVNIAPSQGPLLRDWPQPSARSLLSPSVQPVISSNILDVVHGQAHTDRYTEQVTPIQSNTSDVVKTSSLETTPDMSSDYISMSWLHRQRAGVSHNVDQNGIELGPTSKTLPDDDNGYQKKQNHNNDKYNGEYLMKDNEKAGKSNKNDVNIPVLKDTVIASQSQPEDHVMGKKATEGHLNRVYVQQTTATPFKRADSLTNGTAPNIDRFLIPTPNASDSEPKHVENKTTLTTDRKVKSSQIGSKTKKPKAVVPIITSNKSGKQQMRIFDINAFSIIRSQYLAEVQVQTTTTPTTRSAGLSSSRFTQQQRWPVSATRQTDIVSTTTRSPTSTAHDVVTQTTFRRPTTTKATTTTTTATTTPKFVYIRNKNVIPPALQRMMDAWRRPGFQAGIPINLNQVIASDTEVEGMSKNVNMNEEAGGIKVGTTVDIPLGTATTGLEGISNTRNTETTAGIPTNEPTTPTPAATVTIPTTMTTIDYSTSLMPMEISTMSTPVSTNPPNQGNDLYHTAPVVHTTTDSAIYSTTPSVQHKTTESVTPPITGIPFFVDHLFWKGSNNKLPIGTMEPTTEAPKKSTTSDITKPSVFFGMWSQELPNNSNRERSQKVQTTSSSTSGSDITNNGITYSVMTKSSPSVPVVSIKNLIASETASPRVTTTQTRLPEKVKDVQRVADTGYEVTPLTNLMSENLKPNITNLRRQLGDFFVPSTVIPSLQASQTNTDPIDNGFYQNQNEDTVTVRPKAANDNQNQIKSDISAGVAVDTSSIYRKDSTSVQKPVKNTRLQSVFGAQRPPLQGILIDSSFTVTFPRASSTPPPLSYDNKRTYGESKQVNLNSETVKEAHNFRSNFHTQQQTQISKSHYNAKKKSRDSQATSNAQNEVQMSQSKFYIPQQATKSRSKIPNSDKSMTLFEVPNFFTHMNPFANEDAGVKHRFLKPKTVQGADKPFETAVNEPVFTNTAPKPRKVVSVSKDIKPSDQVSKTSGTENKYDPSIGNIASKSKSGDKYKATKTSTTDAKSDSLKKEVMKTEADIKKSNSARFPTPPQGILIDANFMKNLPFFLGPVDTKLFKGMQRTESRNLRPPNGRMPPKAKPPPATSSSTVTTKSVKNKPPVKPTRTKMEYDLKMLCMQFLRSNINEHTYIPHPADCSKIIQCSPNGNGIQAVARHCPLGLFWDSNTQRCSDPNDVTCFDDPCQKGYFNYSSHGGCGTYYKCFAGVSVPTCCPAGLRFVQNNADSGECVWDTTCSEPCETLQSSSLRKTGGCPTLEVESRNDAYWLLERGSLIMKTCPNGYKYSHPDCRCRSNAKPTTQSYHRCKPEFKLTFDGGIIKDVSDGGLAFSQVNVAGTDNNTAVFRENGYISLWGFQNRYLGRTFSIRMRVRADKGSCSNGGRSIVSNCGPDGPTSVEIACAKDRVAFKANTDNTRVPAVIWADIKDNEWADIIYMYKGNRFSGSVNGRKFSKSVTGNLESRNNPLIIGKCPKSPGFIGEIDQLEIYTHCVP